MANAHKVGLLFGILLGGLHLCWAIVVYLGFAQPIYDFILWAHMIHVPLTVGPFDATAAVTLVVVTAIVGYVIGYIGAWVWNKFRE
ncbi:MAG: hypothetical protein KGI73_03370 [Patescibacteria group bacterium]|nr:hypothetical protein [Patescibacteria group bacterium]